MPNKKAWHAPDIHVAWTVFATDIIGYSKLDWYNPMTPTGTNSIHKS